MTFKNHNDKRGLQTHKNHRPRAVGLSPKRRNNDQITMLHKSFIDKI